MPEKNMPVVDIQLVERLRNTQVDIGNGAESLLSCMHRNISKAQYASSDIRARVPAYAESNLPWDSVRYIAARAKEAQEYLAGGYEEDPLPERFVFTRESLITALANYYHLLNSQSPDGIANRGLVEITFILQLGQIPPMAVPSPETFRAEALARC